jgi:hypothetical protein
MNTTEETVNGHAKRLQIIERIWKCFRLGFGCSPECDAANRAGNKIRKKYGVTDAELGHPAIWGIVTAEEVESAAVVLKGKL